MSYKLHVVLLPSTECVCVCSDRAMTQTDSLLKMQLKIAFCNNVKDLADSVIYYVMLADRIVHHVIFEPGSPYSEEL